MEQNEKKCQKAKELTKEELEQVNGGKGFNPDPKNFPREKDYDNWEAL